MNNELKKGNHHEQNKEILQCIVKKPRTKQGNPAMHHEKTTNQTNNKEIL